MDYVLFRGWAKMDKFRRAYYAIRHCGFSDDETRNFLRVPRRVCREWSRKSTARFNQRLTRRQRERIKEAVLVEGKSYSQTAAEIGCHKQTVGRVIATLRYENAKRAGGIDFRSHRANCPIHGPVTVWPCVACAATGRRNCDRSNPSRIMPRSIQTNFGDTYEINPLPTTVIVDVAPRDGWLFD